MLGRMWKQLPDNIQQLFNRKMQEISLLEKKIERVEAARGFQIQLPEFGLGDPAPLNLQETQDLENFLNGQEGQDEQDFEEMVDIEDLEVLEDLEDLEEVIEMEIEEMDEIEEELERGFLEEEAAVNSIFEEFIDPAFW